MRRKLKFDFISAEVLNSKPKRQRINFILNKIKDGTILVTDCVMKPEEEMELIKETMRRVDRGFPGIEVASMRREERGWRRVLQILNEQGERLIEFIGKLRGKEVKTKLREGITLIGPARYIKKVKKNTKSFSVITGV